MAAKNTVLVVDDEPNIVELNRMYLESAGYRVVAAATGGEALDRLKALAADPGVLKVGQNLKYDLLVLARHGIAIAPYDDTMLISYALDAGRGTHGMDALSERHLGHQPISFDTVTGTGKNRITFDRVPPDRATAYAAEDADVTFRLWQALKPRLPAEAKTTVYETLERPLVEVLAAMERRGILIDRQADAWNPLLLWAEGALSAPLRTGQGIMPVAQGPEVLARLTAQIAAMSDFQVAAFHDLVSLSGSLVIAFAVVHGVRDPETAWKLSRVDEDWQIAQWGADEEAERMAAAKRDDFLFAARFHALG